jgi:hypothetical protein
MYKRIYCFVFLVLGFSLSHAQWLQRNDNIPVKIDNYFIANAWAGGLNAPQFSNIDLNQDGILDLFVFDRQANRVLTFVQTSDVQGQSYWYHAPQYQNAFPNMTNWALLRDFNCDGFPDIYTNFQSGIVVYLNTTSITGSLSFEMFNSGQMLISSYDLGGGPFTAPIYSMSIDMLAIDDLDGDGDMDIISNTESSTGMYYYKSMQVENDNCGAADFICANRCFGMVSEASESFSLYIGDQFNCSLNVVDPRSANRHTGGTISMIDLDDNGIKDIILGDVTESNLAAIYLADTPQGPDSAVAVANNFPQSPPVDLYLFPAAYYVDVTNDGIRDLLSAPNAIFGTEDIQGVRMYANQGTESQPDWIFQSTAFLQNQMVDVGHGAHPVPHDVDADGDRDIVLSARYFDRENLLNRSKLHLLLNDTTAEGDQIFRWSSFDWLNLSQQNWQNIYPALGDWDGDGDWDLIVGELNGNIYRMTNTGSNASPQFTSAQLINDANGVIIDVGQSATPQMIDLNEDGLLDLIIGEKSGNVNYYKNIGTAQSPQWSLVTETLAGAEASSYLGLDGFSVPFVLKDNQGIWNLYLGNEMGTINHYQFEAGTVGLGTLVDSAFQDIREGDRSSSGWADFTGDGTLDMVMGHSGGGIALFTGDDVVIGQSEQAKPDLMLYPNPGTDGLTIAGQNGECDIKIFNALGQCLAHYQKQILPFYVTTSSWSKGMYWIRMQNDSGVATKQWMKN